VTLRIWDGKRCGNFEASKQNLIKKAMKNLFNLKSLLFIFVLSASIVSCKDDKDKDPAPAPDLATQANGIYRLSEVTFEGSTIPASKSTIKGDIRLIRKTANSVDAEVDFRMRATDEEFMVFDAPDLQLIESNGIIEVIDGGETVAEIKGRTITINSRDINDTPFTMTAVK
jgi:hypothetical protein